MTPRVTFLSSRTGLLRTLVWQARLAFRLIREPGVPVLTKTLPALALLYVISPLDFAPDVLPVLGQLDDIGIAAVALEIFLRLCPASMKAFHEGAIAQGRAYSAMPATADFIDAEWRPE
jgi:uncharacterized membrane protein YkvA (DUF1232 family)